MKEKGSNQLYPGLRVLVLGLAKSGFAVARLLLRQGVHVVVNERRVREEVESPVSELELLGAECICGCHPIELLERKFDFIVKNPGISYSVPLLVEAVGRKIPIYTEIEVASWVTASPLYAISGSNGKTTTTTLVGEMLKTANQDPVVAGNIGVVLSGVVEDVHHQRPIVLEVSSFQLLGTQSFHPKIAALLNIYPAHLDYHGTLAAYTEAKWSMFRNMDTSDVAVLNYDQAHVRERAHTLSAKVIWFSANSSQIAEGVCVDGEQIVLVKNATRIPILDKSAIVLKGAHNLENALAAAAISIWAGASAEVVKQVLTQFRGVEHRTEYVCTIDQVEYYNDSKATNEQAALGALKGFVGNIVWIAGGLDRGADFRNMADDIQKRVKAAILLGQSAEKLQQVCKEVGVQTVVRVQTLEDAVKKAHQIARAGDTVLLSPACASWDMFHSFEERGSMFKNAVHKL